MQSKQCTKCGETKPLDAFGKKSRNKDGLQYHCKPCNRAEQKSDRLRRGDEFQEKRRAYREKNREHINAKKMEYYYGDVEKHRLQKREDYRKHREKRKQYNRERYYENRAEILSAHSERYRSDPAAQQAARARTSKWAAENPERRKEIERVYRAKPESKARSAARARKRQAAKLERTPSWANDQLIAAYYKEAKRLEELTGIEFQVDHIIPLQGELVSGLHVETNLQLLTRHDNGRKSNKFDPATFCAHA